MKWIITVETEINALHVYYTVYAQITLFPSVQYNAYICWICLARAVWAAMELSYSVFDLFSNMYQDLQKNGPSSALYLTLGGWTDIRGINIVHYMNWYISKYRELSNLYKYQPCMVWALFCKTTVNLFIFESAHKLRLIFRHLYL